MINGVAIRPALPSDDTLSVTQSLSRKGEASAIATAAAINDSSELTGVTAVTVPVKVIGDVTNISLPTAGTLAATADSTQSLYINGKNVPVYMSLTQTEADRRQAVVNAIHANAGLTGVDAVDNGNGGVTLQAVDGRNVSIWFDSAKVNAGSFGLGSGTVTNTPDGVSAISGGNINTTNAATVYASVALQSEKAIKVEAGTNGVGDKSLVMKLQQAVAQESQVFISCSQVPTAITTINAATYVEFSGSGSINENLNIPNYNGDGDGFGPASIINVFSYQNGVLYKGDGVNPIPIGQIDATLDGTQGKSLRINFIDKDFQYYNSSNQHFYEVVSPSILNWTDAKLAAESKSLLGLHGYLATITSAEEQKFVFDSIKNPSSMWIGASDRQQEEDWKWMTGPEAGTLFFQSGSPVNGQYSNWAQNQPDNAGFGFGEDYVQLFYEPLTGTWNDLPDLENMPAYLVEYGGAGFGTFAGTAISVGDLEALKARVIYTNDTSSENTASISINGINIISAPTQRNEILIATALESAINAQINSGALKNVAVQRQGGTLSIKSTVAGTAFQVSGASTNNVANYISVQELTENKVASSSVVNPKDKANFSSLGFYEGTFGGEVDEATSKMSPPRTGRLAFQVGANEGQRITIDLADFGKGGPITGEITWDSDLDPLPPGAPIPVALPGGPNLQGKPLTRTSISSSTGAQEVLKKLDTAMDKVNQTRATMGAVMNRLDHVINNLTNVSMNLSTSRSQIEDSDYASASTELAKTQIMQQAATAVLAQANISQQSVLKLLEH
jgi:flagellin-like hook-associated protein FlgL